ncbi:citramalate synthase [Akkermansia sp.]|uniref:citramalate synthase n=1 Tax=Akkermansia sp. TaxID=1872421 RepID=UPI003995CEC3
MPAKIHLYDTTLRDGAQSEDVNLSATDKVRIARQLDYLGMDYIEGGWPGANPVETEFFKAMREVELKNAKLAAFGSTHHPARTPETDPTLNALISCGAQVATIFGKSCPRHVEVALGISRERNLEIIGDSVAFLKKHLTEVFFDAEHFFDGFKRDAEYALSVLQAAHEHGADCLILCDTNGGTMPEETGSIIRTVKERLPGAVLGIHAHNDCELAVANSLAAVMNGAVQVQGTVNGIGERCGNANLCSVIPNLQLKMGGFSCLSEISLTRLKSTAAFVSEVSNLAPFRRQPFVGTPPSHTRAACVSAIMKDSALYEHMDPSLVGNAQRVLMTEQGGKSNILSLSRTLGFELEKGDPVLDVLSAAVKKNAALGYDYVAAPASAELLFLRHMPDKALKPYFNILRTVVLTSRHEMDPDMMVEASLKIDVHGNVEHTAAGGFGPVHALDRALRRALTRWYPELEQMHLIDYKVRVLSPTRTNIPDAAEENGTGSNVRVLIESSDGVATWTTVGVSYNIIEASLEALADAVTYKLYKTEQARWRAEC